MSENNESFFVRLNHNETSSIHTPGIFSLSDIKQEVLEQKDGSVIRKSTYPNGFSLMLHQSADEIIILSNRPLRRNPDGSYTAPTDAPLSPDQTDS